jgi:hypothetical protein
VSPTLLQVLRSAELTTQRDAANARRWYRRTGMSPSEVRHYGARCAWPTAVELVRRNGAGPYLAAAPRLDWQRA